MTRTPPALELAKGAIAYNAGEFESALTQIQAAGRLGKSTDEMARRFLAEEWTAEVLLALDRTDEALQLSNQLLRAAERGHQAWEIRTIESFQARLSLMVGRLADTSAILEDRFSVEGAHSMDPEAGSLPTTPGIRVRGAVPGIRSPPRRTIGSTQSRKPGGCQPGRSL